MNYFQNHTSISLIASIKAGLCKYKSVLSYLLFGVLTTVVSIGVFAVCNYSFGFGELIANVISWVCAVTFAYFTNRIWVFGSEAHGKDVISEAIGFYLGRAFTLGIEEAMLIVFVTIMHFDALIIKLIAQVVVLISNYIISKLLIFKNKKNS